MFEQKPFFNSPWTLFACKISITPNIFINIALFSTGVM